MVTKRLARTNVIAAFETFDAASVALDRLADADVPNDELSLLAKDLEMRPGEGSPKTTQAVGTSGIAKVAGAGLLASGGAGGVLGALVAAGVAAIPGVGLAVGAAALYGALAGAATGGVAGGLIGAEASARKSMMWEQTLNPLLTRVEEGLVLVGVHTDDEARAASAADILEELEPVELAQLEADESFEPPGDFAAIAGRDLPSGDPQSPGGELGHDQVDHPDGKLLGMEERGDTATSGRDDAAEREGRIPSPDDDGDDGGS